jgi:hypothetical protein
LKVEHQAGAISRQLIHSVDKGIDAPVLERRTCELKVLETPVDESVPSVDRIIDCSCKVLRNG